MRKPDTPPTPEGIISYQKLRTFIGFTGILLPVLTVLGCLVTGAKGASFQISISHFYYTNMHIVFVAVLCMLGSFLITYQGKAKSESRLSNLAGYLAIAIAAWPTAFDCFKFNENGTNQYLQLCKEVSPAWGSAHFAFAAGLFLCFIVFCLKYFQRADDTYTGKEKEKFERRKVIYKVCGWTIIVSMLLIALFNFVIEPTKGIFVYSTFIFETTSLWAFGFAWLVKGSASLIDVPVIKNMVQSIR